MHKCSEEMYKVCLNNAKCHLCDGKRLYKEPKWMTRKKKAEERKKNRIKKQKKEGMSFEKKVKKAYNKSLHANNRGRTAYRRPGSGAIWCMPGDIITQQELMECKERGTTTSKGEKTITVHKAQLEKIKQEAYLAKKDIWYYIFGFKKDDKIYLTKDFNDELRMIQQIEMLKERVSELEKQIDNK